MICAAVAALLAVKHLLLTKYILCVNIDLVSLC